MGGGPCRLKGILDQGAAADRARQCMDNTAKIAAAATGGEATVTPARAAEFQAAANAYASICGDVEKELSAFLPVDP